MWHIKFLIYLFEVSISSLAFFILYALFLKNLTFFKINRIYLISALLSSFAIPSLKIEFRHHAVNFISDSKMSDKVEQLTTMSLHPIVSSSQTTISLADIILYIYILIAVFLLLRGLNTVSELFRNTRKVSANINGLKVIYKYSGFVNC